MVRAYLLAGLLCASPAALALSDEAREFMRISKQLEPVQCEKRKLRREIALAEIQIDRDAQTSKLEKRLAQLEPRVMKSSDPEDLAAISRQQREAFYRCE